MKIKISGQAYRAMGHMLDVIEGVQSIDRVRRGGGIQWVVGCTRCAAVIIAEELEYRYSVRTDVTSEFYSTHYACGKNAKQIRRRLGEADGPV